MPRTGSIARRVAVEGLGWVLVLAGIAALVLPGPGLLGIFAGLALLSQQYDWAARRVDPVKLKALQSAADSVETWPRVLFSLVGVLFLAGCGALWILSPPVPGWWPVRDSWWLLGGLWTGVTLEFSALVALGLVLYAFRRFHGKPEAVDALVAGLTAPTGAE